MLTSEEIKEILRKRIAENEKINPRRYHLRQVEDALTELETYQSFLADITDEEARRKMSKNKIRRGLIMHRFYIKRAPYDRHALNLSSSRGMFSVRIFGILL